MIKQVNTKHLYFINCLKAELHREKNRQRDGETDLPFNGLLPKCPQQPQGRSLDGWQGSKDLGLLCCFPRCINRELDQK